MIPVAFDYAAPTSVQEALELLAKAGDEGKILAGGQSLIPVLKLRMAAPGILIDLGKIDELRGIREEGDALVIGAMTRHHKVANDPLVAQHASLLAKATQTVADRQVRHRGTLGGALSHADPAADLPAPALALDAEFVIAGPRGTRTVPASEFFVDLFTTALHEDEILTAVRIPKRTGWFSNYQKFVRVAQQWSIVGVAATVRMDGDTIAEARVALTNMGSVPVRVPSVEQALVGCPIEEEAIARATAGAGEGTTPPSDINGDADYRRHLASVLTKRAILGAVPLSQAAA
ncbi:xanthine dehydrogenase family protein subunit M [Parafrigoribacterium mesophilum]|uniref:FAD binding domain-containing protein n=1 Tax=Parafrigoribacterium mesophilum TaxID=433646 RepID=UPI0031FD05B6